jgi:hypothetical protein
MALPVSALLVVARRRVGAPLVFERQLILAVLAADLGPRLLEYRALGGVGFRRRIGRRRHLVRVVGAGTGS